MWLDLGGGGLTLLDLGGFNLSLMGFLVGLGRLRF